MVHRMGFLSGHSRVGRRALNRWRMPPLAGSLATLLMAMTCGHACAQAANFSLSLRVRSQDAASDAAVVIPPLPRARLLPPSRHAMRLLYDGSADAARRYYESTLPGLGFALRQRSSQGAVWERGSVRAAFQFHPVAGAHQATGILVVLCRLDGEPRPTNDGVPAPCDA